MPLNFFNVNSPRGLVFASVGDGGGNDDSFEVSANSNNPTGTLVRFGQINSSYVNAFQTFSAQRLFTATSNVIEISFRVPGTNIPATASGFVSTLIKELFMNFKRGKQIVIHDSRLDDGQTPPRPLNPLQSSILNFQKHDQRESSDKSGTVHFSRLRQSFIR